MGCFNQQYRTKTHRQEISEKLLEHWEHHAHLYRTWLIRYRILHKEKEELGLDKGRVVSDYLIKKYPQIPFFELKTRREAEDFVDDLDKRDLDELYSKVKRYLSSNSYLEIKAAVYDLDYIIRRTKRKKQEQLLRR